MIAGRMSPSKPQTVEPAGRQDPIRIVIVDDHIFMRDLVARALTRKSGSYAVLAAVGTAAEAIAACEQLKPDLLILDINLPDQNGIDALPELRRVAPTTRVLLCTGFRTDDRIADLARAGAHGFVEKTNTWDEFLQAVERVSHDEYYFCSHHAGIAPESGRFQLVRPSSRGAPLTAREKEVITLIAQGFTSKEIAAKLYISVATVETHRTNLMTKLGVRNVAGLVSYAFRTGLVKPGSSVSLPVQGAQEQLHTSDGSA
jgi:DNA-binding NarL/FixJ family response regulator